MNRHPNWDGFVSFTSRVVLPVSGNRRTGRRRRRASAALEAATRITAGLMGINAREPARETLYDGLARGAPRTSRKRRSLFH